jgi:hypothetical protein
MAVIPDLIARYAGILYALCALGAFFYVWGAFQARRREELALFGKEREDAAGQEQHSWMMAGVCVLLALGVYGVSNFIAPNLVLEQDEAVAIVTPTPTTPSVNLIIPLSPTPLPATPTATAAPIPTVAPIATPLSRPPDTPTPAPTVEGQQAPENVACTSAGTQLTAPQNGARLSGVVKVRGTASLPNFLSYKFELQWPNSEEWVTIQSFEVPVAGGTLGLWDTSLLEPGTYKFRLVVVDNTFNYPEPCVISVVIAPEG